MPNFSGIWNLKEQVQAIAAGRWTGITFSELYAWGGDGALNADFAGQLGQNNTISRSSPVQVSGDDWSLVSAGGQHSMATKTNGTLWGWGNNANGRLGLGDTAKRSSPTQVGSNTDWSSVSAGEDHTIARTVDNKLYGFGANISGQLGLGDTLGKSSPVQVGALTVWAQASTGTEHSGGVRTDGTAWMWGSNSNGELGLGNTANTSSPVQVGALTTWSSIVCAKNGGRFTAGLTTSNELYVWGENGDGQLGLGNTVFRSSPVQVGALADWATVSAGDRNIVSVKTDGTLWAWGDGGVGRLGDGTTVSKSSPVQIGALTNWSQVSMGSFHCAAVKTTGTIWTWGYDNSTIGVLGLVSTEPKSSPTQVGSLATWAQPSCGTRHTLATIQGQSN